MALRLFPAASLRLGKIGQIEVNINVTWLVIVGLLTYWLRTGYVRESAPAMSGYLPWLVSAVAVLALFASVLAHELAHSLVARRNGLMIRKITLFIFGGVAHMESEPQRPGVEFKMALAGPLTSLALAGILGLAWLLVPDWVAGGSVVLVLGYAALANATLACFNMIPGYPLDGGRVLRAILWKVTGSFTRATVVAATLGRVVGLGLVFLGAMLSAAYASPGPLWIVLVGSFLERLAFFSAYRARLLAAAPVTAEWSSEGGFTPPQWSSDQQ